MRADCEFCLNQDWVDNPTPAYRYDTLKPICKVTGEGIEPDEMKRPLTCEHYREDVFLVRACRENKPIVITGYDMVMDPGGFARADFWEYEV